LIGHEFSSCKFRWLGVRARYFLSIRINCDLTPVLQGGYDTCPEFSEFPEFPEFPEISEISVLAECPLLSELALLYRTVLRAVCRLPARITSAP